jgi:hypothetical protein
MPFNGTGVEDNSEDHVSVKNRVSAQMKATPTVGSYFPAERVKSFTRAIGSYTDTSLNIAESRAGQHVIDELNALSGFKIETNQIVMTVNRLKHNSIRTISTFSINDEYTGYIMERDGKPASLETVEGKKKRIQAGTYNFEITTWSKEHPEYIDKSLRIHNVPGRSGILVHRGINQKWSFGCLIVVPEMFTSPTFTFTNESKEALEKESQQEVDKIIDYIKAKKIELMKKK